MRSSILETAEHLVAELSDRFETEEEALEFLESCKGAKFSITDLQTKTIKA